MIAVDPDDLGRLILRLRGLGRLFKAPSGLLRQVGEGVEAQTRQRIFHEKTSPEGVRWRPWSTAYAKTRGPQHSLLVDTHDLVDSIDSKSDSKSATIFSDVVYAGYNQTTRPYLGISAQNAAEMEAFLAPLLEGLFVEAMI